MSTSLRGAVTVLAVAWLVAGCNLLFRAEGKDLADADPFGDAPRADQPMVKGNGISAKPHAGGPDITLFANVEGLPGRLVAYQFDAVVGNTLGTIRMASGAIMLDINGRRRLEVMYSPSMFGMVTVRLRVAYEPTPIEQGNMAGYDFGVALDVGHLDLPTNNTNALVPNTMMYAFPLTFPESGKVTALGMLTNLSESAEVAFALYASDGSDPINQVASPTSGIVAANNRAEASCDHLVNTTQTLYVVVVVGQNVNVKSTGTGGVSVPFVDMGATPSFPTYKNPFGNSSGSLQGDFAVYATLEP